MRPLTPGPSPAGRGVAEGRGEGVSLGKTARPKLPYSKGMVAEILGPFPTVLVVWP